MFSRYYNSAALRGGWAVPDALSYDAGTLNDWATEALKDAGVQKVMNDIYSEYDVSEDALAAALGTAFMYDSALMSGNAANAKLASEIRKQMPKSQQSLFRMIRKRVHAGGTRPSKRTSAMKMEAMEKLLANKEYLKANPWYGSDPYVEGTRQTTGRYVGIFPHPSRKGMPPTRYFEFRSGKTRPFAIKRVAEEEEVVEPAAKSSRSDVSGETAVPSPP